MKTISIGAAVFASLLAFSSSARATVIEPNALEVPLDGKNGETQLYTFFQSSGEAIDWKVDAASTPNTFSPLCGFTSKFVLNQAGNHFGLAWYNETGTAPAASDLHIVIPANSPVGTTFSGTDIKADPAYAGGQVGFALVGGQTHYSNPAWNPACSGCNPAAPWITTLVYPSKTIANAFYLAFEDGNIGTTPSSFNNDGDFNDDVYLVTGVTCEGGGQACDTGKSGICATGLTQCAAGGTTCQQVSQPTTEICNNLDDDCNGQTDEGELCPSGEVCSKGECVPRCGSAEFPCAAGKVCSTSGTCVDPSCANVTCESGKVCVAGTCRAPCDGVVCPGEEVCRNGACVDPCDGVTCESGKVCSKGVCILSCNCQPCEQASTCTTSTGQCVETACQGVTCAAGQRCSAGACVDGCDGVVCPAGQACAAGACKPLPPPAPTDAGNDDGFIEPDAGTSPDTSPDAGSSEPTSDAGLMAASPEESASGCGCTVAGQSNHGELALAGLGLGVALLVRRRRSTR